MKKMLFAGTAVAALVVAGFAYSQVNRGAQGGLQTPAVEITLKDSFDPQPTDAKTTAIVEAANAFLNTLTDEERALALYDFGDNLQRANWSNFPTGPVQRGGVMRGNLTEAQNAAMDALLAEVMSPDGMNNIRYQLAAEELFDEGPGQYPQFGDEYYFISFLAEPSVDQPWMLQFGGHHLAINVTFYGGQASFSPMLTGGEPLKISFDGEDIFITEQELQAAQTLLNSLDDVQRDAAVVSSSAINLLTGPGEFGTVVANEGIRGDQLTDEQQQLLIDVIAARLGFINDDDYAAEMNVISAEIDDTYFGWWGPEQPLGAAYFRVTGPSIVMEYAPQDMDGDPTDHAHNMYRNPLNDYGSAWISAQ
ncbi:DUF3500 domain-containing protein [Loktanella sp. S4079]|uniref:DUF3500 domain-containing protein n=1 Tax=Loktanella sp. S4079 TaxID=579483 RepID=UPI000697F198|nr:DUF3500 domain-containing protein [Loktanella sp. S4079]